MPPPSGIAKVKIESSRRSSEVSSGKANEESSEKKKALRPKAASGKAVAVPR